MNEKLPKYNNDLFKELYYHEIEMKDRMSGRISTSIGILTIILGYLGYVYSKYSVVTNNSSNLFEWSFYALVCCVGLCVFSMFKAFFGYSYKYLPSPKKIEEGMPSFFEFYEQYKPYFDSISKSEEAVINECIENNMHIEIADCATCNREENKRRAKWLRFLSWFMILTIVVITANSYAVFSINNNGNSASKESIPKLQIEIIIKKGGK